MPVFPGGENAFQNYLKNSIVYPETERLLELQGTVYVYFVVNGDGTITNVQVVKGVPGGPGFGNEAVRVIRAMPAWEPASMAERKVRCGMTLPIRFVLSDAPDSVTANDVPASFPGGEAALQNFLDTSMVYPDSAYERQDSGVVGMRFIVEPDGRITHIIFEDPYFTPRTLRLESIRLIQSMPNWQPARKNGVPVRSAASVSIHYTLPTKKQMKTQHRKTNGK